MLRVYGLLVLGLVAAASFGAGLIAAGVVGTQPAHAQASVPASTLPPIFNVGNVVTFGPQGPRLTVLEVYGSWIYVAQERVYSSRPDVGEDPNAERFWLYVPGISDSWRLVEV
jgi:hypothetical protein